MSDNKHRSSIFTPSKLALAIGLSAVLGGCGAVGSVAVRTLTELPDFDEILIADINTQGAQELASKLWDLSLELTSLS